VARLKEFIVRPPLDQRAHIKTPQDLLTDKEMKERLKKMEGVVGKTPEDRSPLRWAGDIRID
jgi:hypothetical protein